MDRQPNSEHHDESLNEYLNLSRMDDSVQMARDASNYKSTPNVLPTAGLRSPTAGGDWQNAPPQYNMMKMMQEMMSNPMLMTNMMMAQFQMMQQMGGMPGMNNLSQSFQEGRQRGSSNFDGPGKNLSGNISTRATPRNVDQAVILQGKQEATKIRNFQLERRYTRHNSVQLDENPSLQKAEETLSQRVPTQPPSMKSTAQKKPQFEPPKQAYVKKPVPFDDMPIRPMNQPTNPKPVKKTSIPFDEMPIKPMPNPYNEFTQKQVRAPMPKTRQPNAYKQSEERPVKGINKNFQQLLQEKLGSQYYEKPNDVEPTESIQPRASNFLKKGTRQFLSSAKYKAANTEKSVDEVQNAPSPALAKKSFKAKDQVKPKPKASKPNPPRQKSPRVNKIIDIEEHSLEKSERKRQKPSPKPNRKIPNNLLASSESQGQQPAQLIDIGAGVRVKPAQFEIIRQKFTLSCQSIKIEEQRLQKLRGKYEQMLKTLQFQREQQQQQFQQEKQQFQQYKKQQLKIIKNQKRIAERQKQAVCVNTNKKEKEELENAKKEWEKQKQDLKKKENSSRILIEKQKRQIEDLRRQVANASVTSTTINNASITTDDARQNRHMDKSIGKKPIQPKKELDQPQKKQHKSILNTEGKYSEQKFKQRSPRDHSQKSDNSVTAAGKNLSSYLPDYEDLKTDRLKKDQKQQQTKVIPRGQPAAVLVQNRRPNPHDQVRVGQANKNWQQYASRSSRSSSSNHSEEAQRYQQGLRIQDLNSIKPLSISMVTQELIEEMFHYYSNEEYQMYQQMISAKGRKIKSERDVDGKIERVYTDGIKQSIFPTGVRKQITPSGYNIINFKNRDIKQKLTDGTILYYFSQKKVDQITLLNKTNIYRFDNNQVEFHFEDGTIEIRHADGSIKVQGKEKK